MELSEEARTTEADPFSMSERPAEVRDSTGTRVNPVHSDQNQNECSNGFSFLGHFSLIKRKKIISLHTIGQSKPNSTPWQSDDVYDYFSVHYCIRPA